MKNLHEFQTNLFCCIRNNRMKYSFNFGSSKVVLQNKGKKVGFRNSAFCVQDEETNIFELLIYSDDFDHSFHILDLIQCSSTIIQSEKTFDLESIKNALLISWNKPSDPPNIVYKQRDAGAYFSCSSYLYYATEMACNAFGNSQKENAIFKYDLARDLTEINPLDLSPANDWPDRVYYHSEQLRFGYSIIACYSILEELNLEIKATRDNPSSRDGSIWNDAVLNDLKGRLVNSGIISEITIPWLVRYAYKRPFKDVVKSSSLCEWADGENFRDFLISICDAILELSYIRDCIASHGVRDRVYELTIYDAENAYALLRKILLHYFFHDDRKFFNWHEGF